VPRIVTISFEADRRALTIVRPYGRWRVGRNLGSWPQFHGEANLPSSFSYVEMARIKKSSGVAPLPYRLYA